MRAKLARNKVYWCLTALLLAPLIVQGAAAKPVSSTWQKEQFYFGIAGGIGHSPYNLRLGWRYGRWTLLELGTAVWGPWVDELNRPAVLMQAIHLGSFRFEWGASYHQGRGKRWIAYSRTMGSLTSEERQRLGMELNCNDSDCRESPITRERDTDFSLLYTHFGVAWQHRVHILGPKAKVAWTLGYTELAYARIKVKSEPNDELLGRWRGISHSNGDTFGPSEYPGIYLQIGIDWPLDLSRASNASRPSSDEDQSSQGELKS